jgi:HEPN domain-containing protein
MSDQNRTDRILNLPDPVVLIEGAAEALEAAEHAAEHGRPDSAVAHAQIAQARATVARAVTEYTGELLDHG